MIPPRKTKSLPPPRKKKLAIHIQKDLIEFERKESCYTSKILAPIYEPKNRKPELIELVDRSKSKALIEAIGKSDISVSEKAFLIDAARRHNVFHYERIADYYAYSSRETQKLMEDSALVIIDFGRAIELGYVRLNGEIAQLYADEHGKT